MKKQYKEFNKKWVLRFLGVSIVYTLIFAGCGSYQQQPVQANKPVATYQINYNADTNALSIKSIDVSPPHAGQTITGLAGVFQSGPTVLSGNLITAPVYIVNNSTSPWTGVEMQMYQLLTGNSVIAAFPDFGTGWFVNSPSYGAWGWLFTSGTTGSPFTINAGGKSVNKVIGYNANSSFVGWALIYANIPIITGISPLGALAGQLITISGFNFSTTNGSVTFNGVTATVITWSSTSITATVPANVTLGNILVKTVDANTPYSNAVIFTPYKIFATPVNSPYGMTVDTVGNIYVASYNGSSTSVKMITPAGVISTYSKTTIPNMADVAMDPTGTGILYLTNGNSSHNIVTVNTSGTVQNFASVGNYLDALYFSDAGQSWPLYVADAGAGKIYSVASNGTPTLFASGFTNPGAITVDASGNVYVGECSNGSVYEINAAGTVTKTVVTGLVCPTCMKQDASGNIYILDNTTTSTMYKYNPSTGNLSFYVSGNGIANANGAFAFNPSFAILYVGQLTPNNDITAIPLK
jgi:sugar lactone lactonase YvrE